MTNPYRTALDSAITNTLEPHQRAALEVIREAIARDLLAEETLDEVAEDMEVEHA